MTDDIKTGTLHSGGVSTDIEINALKSHFGLPGVGHVLTYDELENVIDTTKDTTRFRTVLARYRRSMTEHGIHFATLRNIGLKVLSADDRVDLCIDSAGRAFKTIRTNAENIQQIPRAEMSKEQSRRADTAQVLFAKVASEFTTNKQAIQAPGKADTLPRLNIVKAEQ